MGLAKIGLPGYVAQALTNGIANRSWIAPEEKMRPFWRMGTFLRAGYNRTQACRLPRNCRAIPVGTDSKRDGVIA